MNAEEYRNDGGPADELIVRSNSHTMTQHAAAVDDGLVGKLVLPIDVVVVVVTTLVIDAVTAGQAVVEVVELLEVEAVQEVHVLHLAVLHLATLHVGIVVWLSAFQDECRNDVLVALSLMKSVVGFDRCDGSDD